MDFRLIDISEGGAQVETAVGLAPSSVCELKVNTLGREVVIKAEVRRCRAQMTKTDAGCKVAYRSGLEFLNLDDERASAVRQIIAENCDVAAGPNGSLVSEGAVVAGSLYTV